MVNVVIFNNANMSCTLPFKTMEDACKAMDVLASTVIPEIAFSVSVKKEEIPKSRFINPEGGEKDA